LLIHHLILKIWYRLKSLRNLALSKIILCQNIILWKILIQEEHLRVLSLNELLIGLHVEIWVYSRQSWVSVILVEIVILAHLRQIQLLGTLIHIHLLICELIVLIHLLLNLKILLHRLIVGTAEFLKSSSRCAHVVRTCFAVCQFNKSCLLIFYTLPFRHILLNLVAWWFILLIYRFFVLLKVGCLLLLVTIFWNCGLWGWFLNALKYRRVNAPLFLWFHYYNSSILKI
jgi:hypothetical protein